MVPNAAVAVAWGGDRSTRFWQMFSAPSNWNRPHTGHTSVPEGAQPVHIVLDPRSPRRSALCSSAFRISTDAPYFSSLYYDGQYLFWSKYSESQSCTELIAWDCEGTDDVYRLGTFGTEVWPVCGLFQLEGAENVSQNLVDLSQSQATATAAVGTMELQQENRISGGLQSAVLTESQAHPEILPNSTGSYDEAKGTVTVAVTAGQVSTNGRATISYDSATRAAN